MLSGSAARFRQRFGGFIDAKGAKHAGTELIA